MACMVAACDVGGNSRLPCKDVGSSDTLVFAICELAYRSEFNRLAAMPEFRHRAGLGDADRGIA